MEEESRVRNAMLLDFYGELLTEKQRECFDLHYNEDLSLSEIAEQSGISRQGVWDNIRRAEAAMTEIENKTGLLSRFRELSRGLSSLAGKLESLSSLTEGEANDITAAALAEVRALMARR